MAARLGCIGTGAMGSAILRGLADRDDLELFGYDIAREPLEKLAGEIGFKAMNTPKELAKAVDYVVVAVKPHQVASLLKDLAPILGMSETVISIAAGVTVAQLKTSSSGVCPVVRVMPNTPAMVQSGVFAVCLDDPDLKPAQKEMVQSIFAPLGQVHVLEEKYFDAFTAVCGSGPAYVFYFMEAMVEAGVTLGLTRPQATEMVKGLFSGSAKLAEQDIHLSVLREMVTSPAGTTIEATGCLDRSAVRAAIIDAVKAAARRSKELGE